MPDKKITLDRGDWVHDLTPDDLPETFRFATVDITDRAKFLEYFAYDLKNAGGTKRVTFGHGMLRDLYELAVVVMNSRMRPQGRGERERAVVAEVPVV